MIRRLMRFCRWIGQSGTSAVIAEQFGTAMMPLCSLIRRPLISGITKGTPGSIRKADELSMTTAPAFAAIGENRFEGPLPAENSAMSTPSNERSLSSSTTISCPRKASLLPAERLLASAFSRLMRKPRLLRVAMNSAPTAPVTPAMATTGSSDTLHFRHPDDSTHEPAALREFSPVHVRFGSEAAIAGLLGNVRFTPKADKEQTCRHVRFVPLATEVRRTKIAAWPRYKNCGL